MVSFNTISEKTGIPLPSMFVQWLKDGLTHYENWEATWRKRMLESPPALASVYDFQWLTADQSQAAQEKWLNPDCQGGIRFLPFGRSGAGDCYSLIPVETDVLAVALIAHDSGKLVWCGRSFAEFACTKMIEACMDHDHLLDDDFSEAEVTLCLLADLSNVSKALPPEFALQLQPIITQLEIASTRLDNGRQSHEAPEILNDQEWAELNAHFSIAGLPELTCVPRWKCT